jgi:DNA-3-methyladenine glycosylase
VSRFEDKIAFGEMMAASAVAPRRFYNRPTVEVARDLLGKIIVRGSTAGMIVEAEAYLGLDDPAAHASRGITDRTRVIFGPPGHAYVYLIYGMYECLNLVAEPDSVPGCVLIRAIEPLCGLDKMAARRPAANRVEQLANGPGRLTRALEITRRQYGADVTREGGLMVRAWNGGHRLAAPFAVATSGRIGLTVCADWPLRFCVAGSPFVSRKAPAER